MVGSDLKNSLPRLYFLVLPLCFHCGPCLTPSSVDSRPSPPCLQNIYDLKLQQIFSCDPLRYLCSPGCLLFFLTDFLVLADFVLFGMSSAGSFLFSPECIRNLIHPGLIVYAFQPRIQFPWLLQCHLLPLSLQTNWK